jgi:hypothetical protein
MTTTNIFEQAARLRIRFESPKGPLTVEDLFILPLTSQTEKANLDDIARSLHLQLKNSDAISFVTPAQGADQVTQTKFDIVKYVIDIRIAERDAAAIAADRKAKKQQILSLISQKENDKLAGSSLEELRAMAESL